MSYKVKSPVYFVCLLTVTFTYYSMDNNGNFENESTMNIAELSMEGDSLEKTIELK